MPVSADERSWWWEAAKCLVAAQKAVDKASAYNVGDSAVVIVPFQETIREAQARLLDIFGAKGILPTQVTSPSIPQAMTPPSMPPMGPSMPQRSQMQQMPQMQPTQPTQSMQPQSMQQRPAVEIPWAAINAEGRSWVESPPDDAEAPVDAEIVAEPVAEPSSEAEPIAAEPAEAAPAPEAPALEPPTPTAAETDPTSDTMSLPS